MTNKNVKTEHHEEVTAVTISAYPDGKDGIAHTLVIQAIGAPRKAGGSRTLLQINGINGAEAAQKMVKVATEISLNPKLPIGNLRKELHRRFAGRVFMLKGFTI